MFQDGSMKTISSASRTRSKWQPPAEHSNAATALRSTRPTTTGMTCTRQRRALPHLSASFQTGSAYQGLNSRTQRRRFAYLPPSFLPDALEMILTLHASELGNCSCRSARHLAVTRHNLAPQLKRIWTATQHDWFPALPS